jgi:MinD superfamily P-loop ATPase
MSKESDLRVKGVLTGEAAELKWLDLQLSETDSDVDVNGYSYTCAGAHPEDTCDAAIDRSKPSTDNSWFRCKECKAVGPSDAILYEYKTTNDKITETLACPACGYHFRYYTKDNDFSIFNPLRMYTGVIGT